ncbi:MAG: YdeI/OmpD-associated family protein [Ferruginibacter sp.]
MIIFNAIIERFEQQGEKSGWTYIRIPAATAEKLQTGNKKSFRIKGKLDAHSISGISLIPIGGGDFILTLNTALRKAIGKSKGAMVKVQLAVDKIPYMINAALTECINDEPGALVFFKSLPTAHQNYFSKWIDSAKTEATKVKRIARAVTALSRQMGFSEMFHANKNETDGIL